MIYFIKSSEYVKIGFTTTAQQVLRRMQVLQIGNPITLELIHLIEGNIASEYLLHKQFKGDYIRGEWFLLSADIKRFIANTCNIKIELIPVIKKIRKRKLPKPKAELKTHCIRGHLFDEKNTYRKAGNNKRWCRKCRSIRVAKARNKDK